MLMSLQQNIMMYRKILFINIYIRKSTYFMIFIPAYGMKINLAHMMNESVFVGLHNLRRT